MNVKKTLLITICMVLLTSIIVYARPHAQISQLQIANESINDVVLRWENTSSVLPSISISDNTATASVYIKAMESSASISGTLYLEKKVNGKWSSETSWSISGTGTVNTSKTNKVTSGIEYRTRVVATVTNNGVSETIEVSSSGKTA